MGGMIRAYVTRHRCQPPWGQGNVGDVRRCATCGKRWRYEPQHLVLAPGWYSLLDLRFRAACSALVVVGGLAFTVALFAGWLA